MKANFNSIRKKFLVGLFWSILVVSFLFFSILIVLKANGYKLNLTTWQLKKTGMIVLDADPHGTIYFDGKTLKNQRFPSRISNLNEGTYNVEITQPNYQSWEKVVSVVAGQASVYDNIILFKDSPTDTNAPQGLTSEQITAEMKNYQSGLTVSGSEILVGENLITRFSQNVATAVYFPDRDHIVFQIGDQIRVIDIDGTNNKLLFKLNSTDPTPISFRQNGNVVIYFDTKTGQAAGKIIH